MNKSKQVVRVDDKSTKQVKVSNVDPRKVWSIIGGALAAIAVIAICVVIGYDSFHKDPIVTVDGKDYKVDNDIVKFNIYQGEVNLQYSSSMYAQIYQMTQEQFIDSYLPTIKANTLDGLTENIIMQKEAEKNGEKLSDEDKQKATDEFSKQYDKMTSARKKALGLSKEEFVEQGLNMTLASQYVKKLTEGYNITADTITTKVDKSKFDERSFEVIQVATTTADEQGKSNPISDTDKQKYLDQMKKYLAQAKEGKDLSKLVSKDDSKTYTYTTESLLTTDTTYADLMKKIKDLKDKEVYKEVIDADGYLWVVKMKDSKVTTQYDQAVQQEIQTEQQAKLDEQITALKESYKVSTGKGWDKVDFGNMMVKNGDKLEELQPDPTETPAATPAASDQASATPAASPEATK